MRRLVLFTICATVLAVTAATRAGDVEFLCGDANFDGKVSLADAQFIWNAFFRTEVEGLEFGEPWPFCWAALETTGDGQVDLADARALEKFLLEGGEPPHSSGGPESLGCDTIPDAPVLVDPGAEMAIVDVTSDGVSGVATITIALSNSTNVGSFRGVISGPFGGSDALETHDLSGALDERQGYAIARTVGGTIVFGFRSAVSEPLWIVPGEDVAVFQITACLESGTAAGEHDLELLAGEFADAQSGRSIEPALRGGRLTLAAVVPASAGCDWSPEKNPAPDDDLCSVTLEEPSTGGGPGGEPLCGGFGPEDDLNAVFELTGAAASPGGSAIVSFVSTTSAPLDGFSISIDFDESALRLSSVEPAFERPDGGEWDFARFAVDNDDESSGSGGLDEGYVTGAAVFSFIAPGQSAPAGDAVEILRLGFDVLPSAPSGSSTEVRFLESGSGVRNQATVCGARVLPEGASSFVFIDAAVEILPEVTIFVRGDANGDGTVDVSDPQASLGFLFLGRVRPACFDAADANDDGELNVADAISSLRFLFQDGPQPPPPYPAAGPDTTPDRMSCLSRDATSS